MSDFYQVAVNTPMYAVQPHPWGCNPEKTKHNQNETS